jgi:hypothetical protein
VEHCRHPLHVELEATQGYIDDSGNQVVLVGSALPYWGAVFAPWRLSTSVRWSGSSARISVSVSYPCPAPFPCAMLPAAAASVATIALVSGNATFTTATTVSLGAVAAGATATVEFGLRVSDSSPPPTVTITAAGRVSDTVPLTCCQNGNDPYPSYSYTDSIGGAASVFLNRGTTVSGLGASDGSGTAGSSISLGPGAVFAIAAAACTVLASVAAAVHWRRRRLAGASEVMTADSESVSLDMRGVSDASCMCVSRP